ncbi:hypothetical protein Emag_006615 [Eimeria magna]
MLQLLVYSGPHLLPLPAASFEDEQSRGLMPPAAEAAAAAAAAPEVATTADGHACRAVGPAVLLEALQQQREGQGSVPVSAACSILHPANPKETREGQPGEYTSGAHLRILLLLLPCWHTRGRRYIGPLFSRKTAEAAAATAAAAAAVAAA